MIFEMDPGDLVKGDHVPYPNKAYLPAREIIEEVGDGRLAARDQDAVGADLLIDVALARPARAQLTDVVVVLNEGHHAGQQMPFSALIKRGRLHARGTQ